MFFIYVRKLISISTIGIVSSLSISEINSHDKCDFLVAHTISERYELLIHFLLPRIHPTVGCCACNISSIMSVAIKPVQNCWQLS